MRQRAARLPLCGSRSRIRSREKPQTSRHILVPRLTALSAYFRWPALRTLVTLPTCKPVGLNEEVALTNLTRRAKNPVHPRTSSSRIDEKHHRF